MSAAHKSENPAATEFHAKQSTNAAIVAPAEKIGNLQAKRLANIVAQMALAGHQVHELEHGFLVCRWGMTKVCPDLAALVGFARQIGASS